MGRNHPKNHLILKVPLQHRPSWKQLRRARLRRKELRQRRLSWVPFHDSDVHPLEQEVKPYEKTSARVLYTTNDYAEATVRKAASEEF